MEETRYRSRKQMNDDSYIYIYMQKWQWTVIREVEMRDREDGGTPIPGNGGTKLARWFRRVTMISDCSMQEEADAMSVKGWLVYEATRQIGRYVKGRNASRVECKFRSWLWRDAYVDKEDKQSRWRQMPERE